MTRVLNLTTESPSNASYFGALKSYYAVTSTTAHIFKVCLPTDYLLLVGLLNATVGFTVGGRQLRVWVELLPPTETKTKCGVPVDSPLTPFNETALFNASQGYLDYPAWGGVIGRLGALYPHLVSLYIDDFSHMVALQTGLRAIYYPAVLAEMTSGLRGHGAPHISFHPCVYYLQGELSVPKKFPDLGLALDGPTFCNKSAGTRTLVGRCLFAH